MSQRGVFVVIVVIVLIVVVYSLHIGYCPVSVVCFCSSLSLYISLSLSLYISLSLHLPISPYLYTSLSLYISFNYPTVLLSHYLLDSIKGEYCRCPNWGEKLPFAAFLNCAITLVCIFFIPILSPLFLFSQCRN